MIIGFGGFGTNNGSQFAVYTGVGINSRNGIFVQLEKGGWAELSFVNIENSPATVTLTAYDDSGNTVVTDTICLAAHEKMVKAVENIFIWDISGATYIAYSSDKEIVCF